MGLGVVTTEEFNSFKAEYRKDIEELKQLLTGNSSIHKKWLKTQAFMKKYDIGSHDTLKGMRERKEVKAKKKGGEWYYDTASFLPD